MSKQTDHSLILNAAKACYLRLGVAKTTAADIATEAGMSRATLYRRFPSHEDIFIAVLARDSMEMVAHCEARLRDIVDPTERMVEGILFCLDEIPRRPLHAHLFESETSHWVLSQALPAARLHDICVGMLRDALGLDTDSPVGEPLRQDIDDLGEWILRALISYAMVPSHRARNRDEMRRFLHAMLAPTIGAIAHACAAQLPTKKTRARKGDKK